MKGTKRNVGKMPLWPYWFVKLKDITEWKVGSVSAINAK